MGSTISFVAVTPSGSPLVMDSQWHVEHPLPDGSVATVRLVRPEDKPLFVRAAAEFSTETMVRRFFSPKPRFTEAELAYLTEPDGFDHFALVAVRPDGVVRQGLGAARFIRDVEEPTMAEFAIVVGDPWQRCGLGTAFLVHLMAAARERGVLRFKGDILATNHAAFR